MMLLGYVKDIMRRSLLIGLPFNLSGFGLGDVVMGSIVGFLLYGATLSPLIALIARALLRLLRALGRRLAACALVRRLLK